jgi:hypothetical protein
MSRPLHRFGGVVLAFAHISLPFGTIVLVIAAAAVVAAVSTVTGDPSRRAQGVLAAAR